MHGNYLLHLVGLCLSSLTPRVGIFFACIRTFFSFLTLPTVNCSAVSVFLSYL